MINKADNAKPLPNGTLFSKLDLFNRYIKRLKRDPSRTTKLSIWYPNRAPIDASKIKSPPPMPSFFLKQ